jgi:hypothetical protein
MKTLYLLIAAILFTSSSLAQDWQKVDQSEYGMKYELPKTWEIDGFGWSNDWESAGSSVCDCTGTINIGNRFTDEEIFMVVYPTRTKDSLKATKRQQVWGMTFRQTGGQDLLTTENCQFTRKIGVWDDPEPPLYYEGDIVWQMKTKKHDQYYMLYFWAKQEVWEQHENTVAKIINSFRPVRAK